MPYSRKRPPLDPCPVEEVLGIVAGKWKSRLMLLLAAEPRRLSALRRALPGTSNEVLIAQLTALEADGMVAITAEQVGRSSARRYALTPAGHSLMPVLDVLADWGLARIRRRGLDWWVPDVVARSAAQPQAVP